MPNDVIRCVDTLGTGQYKRVSLHGGGYVVWKYSGHLMTYHPDYGVQKWERVRLRQTRNQTCILCGGHLKYDPEHQTEWGVYGWRPMVAWPYHAKANRAARICTDHWSEFDGYQWDEARRVYHTDLSHVLDYGQWIPERDGQGERVTIVRRVRP